MENNHTYDKAVEVLIAKSEKLIRKYPHLKGMQAEIDRRLSNAPDKKSRQEILDIMYHAHRNDLHEILNRLNRILDPVSSPKTELLL